MEVSKLLEKSGLELGKYIEQVYKDFYKVEKFNLDQLTETITDSVKKIGGSFKLVEKK
jgi:hypothetical protein